ncbi:MAG TPA: fibronectin type III domain-containing protein, partial [Chloroflexota bacterium]|nr:fibronectin type III domain-containing protein [Chloroflexota bacterium]
NPVNCFRNGAQVACAQNPPLGYSLSGAYGYNLGVWADLKGGNVEVDVPVSTTSAVPTTVSVRVDTADGWSNPWITPFVQYPVGAGTNIPSITYPSPSTDMIADTTATTHAILDSPSTTGTLYFDIGITANYDTSTSGATIPSPGTYNPSVGWSGLAPGTLYHWRARYTYGAGSTALGVDQTFTTTGTAAVPAIPQGISATTASSTQVTVTWSAVLGATSYEIRRRGPSGSVLSYTLVGTTSDGSTSYTDTSVTANNAYLYKVRAVNSAGSSADSPLDLATTVTFTDDRLIEGVSIIKAAHLSQLRTAVDAVRTLANQGAGVYTDVAAPGLVVKAVHILELRAQYDNAIGILTGRNASWATTPVQGGPISFVDF